MPTRYGALVDGPILATKLHAPAQRPSTVPRPRLTERLSEQTRLTLVAAPAGFGKTSILTEWLATGGAGDRVARHVPEHHVLIGATCSRPSRRWTPA